MSAIAIPPRPPPKARHLDYLQEGHTLKSWLLTTDHKRIGLLYLYSIVIYFLIAAIAAALIRMELITPPGDLVTSETYNKLFTVHGVLMVWFFLIPSIPTVLGNFVIPMMIGAPEGGTFTLSEYRRWLKSAGFATVKTIPVTTAPSRR